MTTGGCLSRPRDFDRWLDDELEGPSRRAVSDHVASCAACRAEAERRDPSRLFGRLVPPAGAAANPADAADFLAGVRRGIALKKTETRARHSRGESAARWLRLAAAFGGVLIAGAAAWRLHDRPVPAEPTVSLAALRPAAAVAPARFPQRSDSPALEGLDRLDARVYDLNPGPGDDEPHVVLIVDAGMDL